MNMEQQGGIKEKGGRSNSIQTPTEFEHKIKRIIMYNLYNI